MLALLACSSPPPKKYGGLPSWLPKSTLPVHRVVQASAAQPQLAVQGDTVSVNLGTDRIMATVTGPDVPPFQYPVPKTTRCTFTVTLTQATGTVGIDPNDFTIVDEQGRLHQPRLSVDRAPTPTAVQPDQELDLKFTDILPTGNGRFRWAPGGGAPIASWDFAVEVD